MWRNVQLSQEWSCWTEAQYLPQSFDFKYTGMSKISKNKHYQIILYIQSRDRHDFPFVPSLAPTLYFKYQAPAFGFWCLLTGTQPTSPIPSESNT